MGAVRYILFAVLVFRSIRFTITTPNIVVIMVDDMGWSDVSYHGSDQIYTPNIDMLAYTGVILHQYYSEPICTPARTAFLTGKYPMRIGMHGFPLYNSEDRGIPLSERLMPSYFKGLNYSTHLIGKWHVGMSKYSYLPTKRGFDTHYGMRGGFVDYFSYKSVENWPSGEEFYGFDLFNGMVPQVNESRYIVDILTKKAIEVINQKRSNPMFLMLAYNAPHSGTPGSLIQPPMDGTKYNRHITHPYRKHYADVVTRLDEGIGQVIEALDRNALLHNTIIAFCSDNGGATTGLYQNAAMNLPLRGKKNTPWEGGVRVPAFIWHPTIKPKVWKGLMHVTDWLPTLIQAAGGNVDREIDGLSLWNPIFFNRASPRKEVLITINPGENQYAAYRLGDYKIIVGKGDTLSNGYYGEPMLHYKPRRPNYYNALKSSTVARILAPMNVHIDPVDVDLKRQNSMIYPKIARASDNCVPNNIRGCLYNITADPLETRDLWANNTMIVTLMTSRLRAFWSAQTIRGPPNLSANANPDKYDHIWTPWISDHDDNFLEYVDEDVDPDFRTKTSYKKPPPNAGVGSRRTEPVKPPPMEEKKFDCKRLSGFKQFLCVLQTSF